MSRKEFILRQLILEAFFRKEKRMIFVTVGTHEQQFNRLIRYIDILRKGEVLEEVFIQTGYSTYEPRYCEWRKMISYQEMERKMREARIVITHGGPSSFIQPLQMGKIPIVIPRQKQYGEHVNDHQVEFVKEISERMGKIIPVYEIEKLGDIISHYDEIIISMSTDVNSNNFAFNQKLDDLVRSIF